MNAYWMWWIAGAALVAAELLTGTFYLLVVGVALIFGGVAAWFGVSVAMQWLIAAALGMIGTVLLQRWKHDLASRTPVQPGLDIGQMVQVQSWGPDGTARVAYRGSTWDGELAASGIPRAKTMYIASMRGSVLILSDRRPDALQPLS
jgi:membrane protein implicated in regulation of membrane protease activity